MEPPGSTGIALKPLILWDFKPVRKLPKGRPAGTISRTSYPAISAALQDKYRHSRIYATHGKHLKFFRASAANCVLSTLKVRLWKREAESPNFEHPARIVPERFI
jgi:hypothetical protein